MKLVVAEKPSVAQSLAAVLGAKEKKDGYLEGSGWLVSWCVGHLVELAQPEAYGEQYAKWRYADLPILPAHWKYDVAKDKKKQLGVLRRLMEDKRVDAVVCATDAGREGELIFRLVYQQAGCSKPILRLWISSMEDAAIRDGFEHLRPGADYDLLYQAALCRAGADWIVGINFLCPVWRHPECGPGNDADAGADRTARGCDPLFSEQALLCAGTHLWRVYRCRGEAGGQSGCGGNTDRL